VVAEPHAPKAEGFDAPCSTDCNTGNLPELPTAPSCVKIFLHIYRQDTDGRAHLEQQQMQKTKKTSKMTSDNNCFFFVTETLKTSGHSKSHNYMSTVNPQAELHAYTHALLVYKIFMINYS